MKCWTMAHRATPVSSQGRSHRWRRRSVVLLVRHDVDASTWRTTEHIGHREDTEPVTVKGTLHWRPISGTAPAPCTVNDQWCVDFHSLVQRPSSYRFKLRPQIWENRAGTCTLEGRDSVTINGHASTERIAFEPDLPSTRSSRSRNCTARPRKVPPPRSFKDQGVVDGSLWRVNGWAKTFPTSYYILPTGIKQQTKR